MNKRLKLLGIFITASLCCYAQTKEFDPSLDPNVTIVSRQSQEEWNSRYMWYPGQLAVSTSNNVPVSQKSVVSM